LLSWPRDIKSFTYLFNRDVFTSMKCSLALGVNSKSSIFSGEQLKNCTTL
jgi:hypothetical protein